MARPARQRLFKFIITISLISIIIILISAILISRLPDYAHLAEEYRAKSGFAVLDSKGRILKLVPDNADNYHLWTRLEDIPYNVRHAFITAEDKRFYSHWGFDPLAIARAAFQNVRHGKIVSGASTITLQVVRMLSPKPRTLRSKIIELFAAAKLERQLSKDEILEIYLNMLPMAGNVRGVPLAARTYFGKNVATLNTHEAIMLSIIPRAPARFNPRKSAGRESLSKEAARICNSGFGAKNGIEQFTKAPSFQITRLPSIAPHFTEMVSPDQDPKEYLSTTLDAKLQTEVQRIVKSHEVELGKKGISQIGLLVVNRNCEILSLMGSFGYGPKKLGYNNAVLARRSGGSILKPFLYAAAIEKTQAPISVIPDVFRTYATPFGDYQPYNSDRRWYGPVSLRIALGNSLNTPAIQVINSLGVDNFYNLLNQLDLISEKSSGPDHYGLGLAIGNVEVRLIDLVQAYSVFVNEGKYKRISFKDNSGLQYERIFSRETTYLINHVLADPSARLLTFGNPSSFDFGFQICIKTGTSSNYRDAWIIGYTTGHIIGIWGGNFKGSSGGGSASSPALGPVFHDIVRAVYGSGQPEDFTRPDTLQENFVCWMSGQIAGPNCPYVGRELFHTGHEGDTCKIAHNDSNSFPLGPGYASWLDKRNTEMGNTRFKLGTRNNGPIASGQKKIEIVTPHDNDRFVISPFKKDKILFRAVPEPVSSHITWMMNGYEIAKTPAPYEFSWIPQRGTHVVHAITPDNLAAKITITVE